MSDTTVPRLRIVAIVLRAYVLPTSSLRAGRFRLALIQLAVGADKTTNIRRACQMVKEAVRNGAGMVVLPVRRGCMGTARTVYVV